VDSIITVRDLAKSYGSHVVLDGVDFELPRGKISAMMGPSGTGKSVLLRLLIGLDRPTRGHVVVDGEDIVGMREHDLYRIRRKMGVLFQDGALFGSLTIADNIAFPLREHTRKSEEEIADIVHQKAALVGLLDHLEKYPAQVSGGMRKRAGLARALALDPEIVLFDEPDSGLDPVRVAYLHELIKETQQGTDTTFFIITHNIPLAMGTADYVGLLYRSKLVRFATADEIDNDRNPIIKQFLEGSSSGPIGMDEMADQDEDRREPAIESSGRVATEP
jgi:phospholipid/cholesterol/gamma-HCH transport system ATP-binding protein